MAVITPTLISGMLTVFKKDFQSALDAARGRDLSAQFLTEIPSGSDSNTYNWLSLWAEFNQWVKGNERVARNIAAHAHQVKNLKWESTVEIAAEDIEDDNIGYLRAIPQTQAEAYYRWKMQQIALLLKDGASTIGYDGQNFFDTDHPVYAKVDGTGTESTQSNIYGDVAATGAPWYLLDMKKGLKPFLFQIRRPLRVVNKTSPENSDAVFMRDVYQFGLDFRGAAAHTLYHLAQMSKEALNASSFAGAWQQMAEMKRDGLVPMSVNPTHLVVPPSLRSAAKELIEIDRLENGKGNANYKAVEVIVLPELA